MAAAIFPQLTKASRDLLIQGDELCPSVAMLVLFVRTDRPIFEAGIVKVLAGKIEFTKPIHSLAQTRRQIIRNDCQGAIPILSLVSKLFYFVIPPETG